MHSWTAERLAESSGAQLIDQARAGSGGPERVVIDSRAAGPGALFVGLPGTNVDGGEFASGALEDGAWGVLVAPERAQALARSQPGQGAIIAAGDPLAALQRLATAYRRALGARVIGVTGSTGKTSTKDLLRALIAPQRRTVASRANFNTEIGLPLEILAAPEDTEVLILEMGMRGPGQIAELAAIAEPDVGVIVSVGPVHLELLGSIEAIAAAKSELTAALGPAGTAVVPADEPLLAPHRRDDIATVTFGPGGDVELAGEGEDSVQVLQDGRTIELTVPFAQAHMRRNLLAAVAAARAIGVEPSGPVALELSAGRGQRIRTSGGIVVIDDCYNANPMSMKAALDDLARADVDGGRRIAVLGDMLELGPDELAYHEELGRHAQAAGVDVLVTVGRLAAAAADTFAGERHRTADGAEAAELTARLARPGDTVLVKASRGIGLERVVRALQGDAAAATGAPR